MSHLGSPDTTLGEVLSEYGKRLVIIVTELDTGKERYLTPEDDPDLPVRVAVRMSMGVPGLMEPVRYDSKDGKTQHVYVDGGMCDDFPLNAIKANHQTCSYSNPYTPQTLLLNY